MRVGAAMNSANLRRHPLSRPVSVSYWFLYAAWGYVGMHVLFLSAPPPFASRRVYSRRRLELTINAK